MTIVYKCPACGDALFDDMKVCRNCSFEITDENKDELELMDKDKKDK